MASKYGTQTVDSLAQEPSALPVQLIGLSDCPATEVRAERSNHRTIAKAQLHAVGSIADISANWSAKVVVASNEQVTPENDGVAGHIVPRQGFGITVQLYHAGRQDQNGSSLRLYVSNTLEGWLEPGCSSSHQAVLWQN